MKNILIISASLIFCHQIAFGQLQKGTIKIDGSLGFNSQTFKSQTTNNGVQEEKQLHDALSLSTSFGQFVSESSLFGIGVGYFNSQFSYNSDAKYHYNLISLRPYYEKYINLSDKIYLTIYAGLIAGYGRHNFDESGETDVWQLSVSANPGIVYFLNSNLALGAHIGSLRYRYTKEKTQSNQSGTENSGSSHDYGLNFNINTFSVSIKYYLRTVKE